MLVKRIVWTMLALSTYLGLFSSGQGPTAPAQAADEDWAPMAYDDCVHVGADGRVTVEPGDCTPPITSPVLQPQGS